MTTQPDVRWQRHQLIRLSRGAWRRILGSCTDDADIDALQAWARHDWPVIVRRPAPGDPAGVPVGLPLTPARGKRRIALLVSPTDIASTAALPTFADVAAAAPASWRPCLTILDDLMAIYTIEAGVFGSLAWQHLTGEAYLSASSDLDVAWSFPARRQLANFLDDLADIEACAPMRIDGELVRTDGAGVNWRELWSDHPELAIKTTSAVNLQSRATFMALLP